MEEGLNGAIDELLDLEQNLMGMCKDFEVRLTSCLKIPNVQASADKTISLEEGVSQYIPPMFMPKHRLDSLSLGDGEEYSTSTSSGNTGTGFQVNSEYIAELVQTNPFEHIATIAEMAKCGVDRTRALW
jgi:hypothetical protein